MPILHASFPNVASASEALEALRTAEIPFHNTSVFGGEAALRGRAVGGGLPYVAPSHVGVGEILTVLGAGIVAAGMIATGVGIFAAGPLGVALTGLGAGSIGGGFFAALAGAGVAENDVRAAESALVRGGVVLLLEVADEDAPRARGLLDALTADRAPSMWERDTLPDNSAGGEVEGEGSRSAARRYDRSVEATVARGDIERLARDAKRAVDDPVEGPELERADERARRGPVWIDTATK